MGGGTPIITPMHQCMAANHISRIEGIVNGTTNFMLTKMKRDGMRFDEALKLAQQLGYAETKDPGDDVDGRDACRKIAILGSLACGHHIYPDNVPARGIRELTPLDVRAAESRDCVVKLIAWYREEADGSLAAGVEPMLVPEHNQLAGVDDVFNAILVKGDMLGDVVFYGKGRGQAAHRQRRGGRRDRRPEGGRRHPRQPVLAAGRKAGPHAAGQRRLHLAPAGAGRRLRAPAAFGAGAQRGRRDGLPGGQRHPAPRSMRWPPNCRPAAASCCWP